MRRRPGYIVVIAVLVAVACIRLGFWQLDRHAERRNYNSGIAAGMAAPPVPLERALAEDSNPRYRRVLLAGSYDFESEIILTTRTRNGSPGVNILTPVRLAGHDTAVLVNRGWIYAPDGMSADLASWREPPTAEGMAYVESFGQPRAGQARSAAHSRAYRWVDHPTVSRIFPYPIAPWHVVLISGAGNSPATTPARLPQPELGDGPHLSYAVQWFSFATISLVGMIVLLRKGNG